jgi:CHAT domain-containing protein
MMRLSVIGVLLFLVCNVHGQSIKPWQKAADTYLNTIFSGDESFEGPDQLEALRVALEKDFNDHSQDIQRTQLLAVLSADRSSDKAPVYFEKVVKTYNQQPFRKALFLMDYAMALDARSPEARQHMQTALKLFEESKTDTSVAYVHAVTDFAGLLVRLKDFQSAFQYYNLALTKADQNPGKDSELYNDILHGLAGYYSRIGNAELAVQQGAIARKNEDQKLGINKPYQLLFREKFEPSERMMGKNTSLADKIRLALLYRYASYSGVPIAYSSLNTYRRIQSQAIYNEVIRSLQAEKAAPRQLAAFILDKGVLELRSANHHESTADLAQAVNFYRQLNPKTSDDQVQFYTALNLLGAAHYETGEYAKALACFEEIKSGFEKLRLDQGAWYDRLLHNLVLASEKASKKERLSQLLKPYTAPDQSTVFATDSKERMTKYGDLLFETGDYTGAFRLYSRAHSQFWGEKQDEFYREKREPMLDDQGNEIKMIDQDQVLVNIGTTEVVNEIHDYRPMGDLYTQLLYKLACAAFMVNDYAKASEYTVAYINEFYTRLERANMAYEHGTDLFEIYRLKEELFPAYDLFQNILMADTLADKNVMIENKMRAFTQVIDSRANLQYEYRHMRTVIEDGKDENLKKAFKEYLAKRNELVQLKLSQDSDRQTIEDLSIAIDTLRTFLSSKTAIFTPLSEKFVFWEDIRKKLGRNEAAIELKRFHQYDSGRWTDNVIYAAYIITPVSAYPEVVFLRDGKFLEGRALKFYQNSIQAKTEDTRSYNIFWKPLHEKLPGIYKIFFSPEGVYNQINILTLYNESAKRYLVDELQVYQVISTKELRDRKDLSKSVKTAILMGRPAYYIDEPASKTSVQDSLHHTPERAITRAQIASGAISDLPGTEKEVMAIHKTLSGQGVETHIYTGKNASEENFKQAEADVIHVATHGFWFRPDPAVERADAMFNSGLLFAGVKNNYVENARHGSEDGILTAYELQGMNLDKTQLVLLSACETGLGHIETGEGVYGLQRALTIAGVDKIIMSLWKVDDQATQELFTVFYENWVKSYSITEAFRQAQIRLKTKYKSPYYWGAFVLID